MINAEECEAAGIAADEVDIIARGISRYAKMAGKLGVTIFGGTGSGSIRIHDDDRKGALILATIDGPFDGGCGAACNDEEGLLRGETA
jgi:hypothetical protein